MKLLCIFLLFSVLLVHNKAIAQVKFGKDLIKLYTFFKHEKCFDFYKDSTFSFFYRTEKDSGLLCIKGLWHSVKTDTGQLFILKEIDRHFACYNIEDNEFGNWFNDTLYHLIFSENKYKFEGAIFRDERYTRILPVKKLKHRRKIPNEFITLDYFYSDAVAYSYIENKYNLQIMFGRIPLLKYWVAGILFTDEEIHVFQLEWQRVYDSYSASEYFLKNKICSCYE